MKAYVTTVIRQEIEVPEGADKQAVLNFLARDQDFTEAFVGVSDLTQTYRIIGVQVVDETVTEIGEESFDN